MIDVQKDELFRVEELVQTQLGRRINKHILWRWRIKGVRGARLEAVNIGKDWYTTRGAFSDWVSAQNNAKTTLPETDPAKDVSRSKRTKQKLQQARLV